MVDISSRYLVVSLKSVLILFLGHWEEVCNLHLLLLDGGEREQRRVSGAGDGDTWQVHLQFHPFPLLPLLLQHLPLLPGGAWTLKNQHTITNNLRCKRKTEEFLWFFYRLSSETSSAFSAANFFSISSSSSSSSFSFSSLFSFFFFCDSSSELPPSSSELKLKTRQNILF